MLLFLLYFRSNKCRLGEQKRLECVSRGFLEYEKCDRDRVKYNELRRETWRWFYMDYFNRIFVLDVTYLI